jgi:hypothetical protein
VKSNYNSPYHVLMGNIILKKAKLNVLFVQLDLSVWALEQPILPNVAQVILASLREVLILHSFVPQDLTVHQ